MLGGLHASATRCAVPVVRRSPSGLSHRRPIAWLTALSIALAAALPITVTRVAVTRGVDQAAPDHLVVSEVVTGGASASDELIELYNPTPAALPLEGLELIYVSASGATITRRALWSLGSPLVPAGGHVLVANEAGLYAPVADATYASGMAATGGSVALRIQGAATAIDAAGWGSAASSWIEGSPAPAPDAGASLERLPGGTLGSTQDTDDNLADFSVRLVPEPQNLGSPPTPAPGATPSPAPSASTAPTLPPTASPTVQATPSPSSAAVISVAAARAAPDETTVTIEAVALTAHDFHDGGGFVADGSGGIAVLLSDGAYARGDLLRVTGEVDDRFAQRTLRSTAADLVLLGPGTQPTPAATATGSLNEAVEGTLVQVSGMVVGSPTSLTTGVAFDIDDGSGAVRLVVGAGTGIDVGGWSSGTRLDLVGVAGQRDSSGGGTSGYRVMPRDAADIREVTTPASPTPGPSGAGSPPASGSPPANDVLPISEARGADKNARVVIRGTVTLPTGLVDEDTAVVQDASGAILLRLVGEAGALVLGERIEVSGARSTKSGMESIRVTVEPRRLGEGAPPAPLTVRTGEADEAHEALVVLARGALVASARRSSKGTVSFEIDDGTGPLRVSVAASLEADDEALAKGTWVEVRGVLGQETSGSQPREGYRVWPRSAGEVRITAAVVEADEGDAPGSGGSTGGGGPVGALDGVEAADLAALRIGATLVVGPWKELGVGGLLWDGSRLVAVDAASGQLVASVIGRRQLPLAVELTGMRARGTEPTTGAPLVSLGRAPGQVAPAGALPSGPRGELAGERPAWVSLVGRLSGEGSEMVLVVGERRVPVDQRCHDRADARGVKSVTGVAAGDPAHLIVPCGGIRSAPSLHDLPSALAAVVPVGATPPPAPAPAAVVPDSRRLAGALMLLAAAMLGGTACVRRLRNAAAALEPDATVAGDADGAAEPPRLALVRVRPEHGP